MTLSELDQLIKTVCPIYGINNKGDIHFKEEATEQQRTDARTIVEANIANVED